MGIFEKAIPKYIVNPIDSTVQVEPQSVYVDDIFDPVFNANVRNALRQKYGGGLYSIAGGYSELLNNTWNGDGGILGKGMGLLSTFGRSMEKADDIVLGALTEGVKGLTGQGFENPIENIFVNDQDYSGKRLLASTANIFSKLAGGTKLTEDDLGTAWNIPSLGIELATDVGILGGGLARKLAPAASKMTSKELFSNLGKSGLKTTVGEIGQLMSNYDDLMTKVAIDISAPGLRPAFKKLGRQLAKYTATHSPLAYADVDIDLQDPNIIKAMQEYFDNDPSIKMQDNIDQVIDSIPDTAEHVTKTESDILKDVEEDQYVQKLKFLRKHLKDTKGYSRRTADLEKYISEKSELLNTLDLDLASEFFSKLEGSGIAEVVSRIKELKIPLEQIGANEPVFAKASTSDLENVRNVIREIRPNLNRFYDEDVEILLNNDDALKYAIENDTFSAYDTDNNKILKALGEVKKTHSANSVKYNPAFTVSPSRLSKLEKYGVQGTSFSRNLLETVRYSAKNPDLPLFDSPESLNKFLDSSRMYTVVKKYFNPYISDFSKKGMYLPASEYKVVTEKVDEFKSILQRVFFPEKYNTGEYTTALQELQDFLNTSKLENFQAVRTSKLSEASKYSKPSKRINFETVKASAPFEELFLKDLYDVMDVIDSSYLQRFSKDLDSLSNANFENLKNILNQIQPYLKDESQLKYILEPVADIVQVIPKTKDISGLSKEAAKKLRKSLYFDILKRSAKEYWEYVPDKLVFDEAYRLYGLPENWSSESLTEIRKYLAESMTLKDLKNNKLVNSIADSELRSYIRKASETVSKTTLPVSEHTKNIVNAFVKDFKSDILPYIEKYGSPYGFKPDSVSYKEYFNIRASLGLKDKKGFVTVNPYGYHYREMLKEMWDSKTGKFKYDLKDPIDNQRAYNAIESAAISTELSQRKFEIKEFAFEDEINPIFNKYRRQPSKTKQVSQEISDIRTVISNETPINVSKQVYETSSPAQIAVDDVIKNIVGDVDEFIKKGGTKDDAIKFFGTKKWNLYEQIQKARAIPRINAQRAGRATLRTKVTELLGKMFEKITTQATPAEFKRFYVLRQKSIGDTVKGSDFWTVFRRSGLLAVPYQKGSDMINATEKTLKQNAKIINDTIGKEVVEVQVFKFNDTADSPVIVSMRWKGDKKTAKYVKKAQKELDAAKFDDVVFTKPYTLTAEEQAFLSSPTMRELSNLMDQLQAQAADQARYLGFNFDSTSPYTKHAMKHDSVTAEVLNDRFYKNMKSEDYDSLSSLISDLEGYRQMDRGTFGTVLQERRFRGDYWLMDGASYSLFEYTPDKIFNATLGDGIFANLQYQTFTDLFINDNFKIKDVFKTPEDLKEVLYATTADGKLSGNLQNLELVTFKTDSNGKVIGLTKFDKLSDEGLKKALADENTILVPANSISHMDNLLRKDIRMNNKFWAFVNKHFTIPFKFGLLSNPGFILGNMSDASLKLATTMTQKYGTTVSEEAANVAESIKIVTNLKNIYYEAFDDWKKTIKEKGIKVPKEAEIADIVAMSPKYKEAFLQYLDGTLKIKEIDPATRKLVDTPVFNNLSKEQIDAARVWMMLQDMQMSSNKLREYSDLAELSHTSDFEVSYNLFDRITQGSGKYNHKDWKSWGLFMNNPIMNGFTNASGGWEELIRTASIVDDLKHKRYTVEQMSEYSKVLNPSLDASRRQFDVHLEEAKNTMFNAQFDYERVNDFISGIGKAVPFPIFFLKNFQYWMDLFMENPQFVDNAIDIQEGLWSGYNEENDKFMTEAKGRGAIPVGGNSLPDWFKGVYKPTPLQSMFGAFNILGDPINDLSYRVNPLINGAATATSHVLPNNELTTLLNNSDNVKYRPYSTNMYERNIRYGDPNFNPLEYTLHRVNPFERATNTYLRTPTKIKEGEFQMSDVLPSVFQPMF